ncbi:MAG: hypothetical protein KKD28_03370, partial [Chloroflexi bacterium]|nr:hypothetical protein [Chloroflexota bacterium]
YHLQFGFIGGYASLGMQCITNILSNYLFFFLSTPANHPPPRIKDYQKDNDQPDSVLTQMSDNLLSHNKQGGRNYQIS